MFRPVVLGEATEHHHMRVLAQMHPSVPIHGFRDNSAGRATIEGQEYVHIACSIRARTGNPYGFRNGEWIPGLTVQFTLTHQGTGAVIEGQLFAMVARDGPHYGINLRMLGAGDYTLVLYLQPPPAKILTRVTGGPAGVPPWWQPFDVPIAFTYRPTGVFPE